MKKTILILGLLLILTACERPATFSNWSPINNATPPGSLSESQQPNSSQTRITPIDVTSSPLPTLDWNTLPEEFPQSMKGYELVSWQVGESWNFTLISGTNREKTFEELMAPDSNVDENGFVKITVSGFAQIKTVLDRLPVESEVFWGGMDLTGQVPEGTLYFSFPPQDSMDDLIAYAKDRGVTLVSLKEPE
jgi:hypothetical protein